MSEIPDRPVIREVPEVSISGRRGEQITSLFMHDAHFILVLEKSTMEEMIGKYMERNDPPLVKVLKDPRVPCDLKCYETLPANIDILNETHKVGPNGEILCTVSYRRQR